MFRLKLAPALAALVFAPGLVLAQSAAQKPTEAIPTPPTNDDIAQSLPQKIREKLEAQGFKEVKVVPNSFIVSAKDKDGVPMQMLIGPDSMTVITPRAGLDGPSIAQHPDNRQRLIQE